MGDIEDEAVESIALIVEDAKDGECCIIFPPLKWDFSSSNLGLPRLSLLFLTSSDPTSPFSPERMSLSLKRRVSLETGLKGACMVLRASLFWIEMVLMLLFPSFLQSVYLTGLSSCSRFDWNGLSFSFYCRLRVRYNLF